MKPAWPDPQLYPFTPRTFTTPHGTLRYLDEGSGPPILMVHGTPTWSFLYRHLVKTLASRYRCIVPDHLGFGLSEAATTFPYTPEAHAATLAALIEQLDLKDYVLVVHDFGGPIGLGAALKQPARVRALVIMNTWLWSNEGIGSFETAGKLASSPLGRFLYLRLNFSPRVLLPQGFGDKAKLTRAVHRHYLAPFQVPSRRKASWTLARELTGSNRWFDALNERFSALSAVPTLLLWGMKDPFFPSTYLERWRDEVPHARVEELADVGHFVPEEAPEVAARQIVQFLEETESSSPPQAAALA